MNEEDTSAATPPELTPSKRIKSLKIRKLINAASSSTLDTVISPSFNVSPQNKKKKVVKVVKSLHQSVNEENLETSYDSEFLLESLEDTSLYFKEKDPKTGKLVIPDSSFRYDAKGNILPYSFVGSTSMFKDLALSPKSLDKLAAIPTSQSSSSEHRISTLEVLKRANVIRYIDPVQILNSKLKQIEEGKAKEEKLEQKQIQNMRTGERIIFERQKKVLEKYSKTTSQWNHIQENLSNRTHKSIENLAFNRGYEYRERIESWDIIDRGISNDEKAGDYCWYMSLRANENSKIPKETYMILGNPMYPLYTRIQERPKSKEAVIRKPGMIQTTYKTFRDDSYYQTRVTQENTKSGEKSSIKPEDLDELYVQGVAKLPLEIEAAHMLGLQYVHPELIPAGGKEEIIEMHYDKLIKY